MEVTSTQIELKEGQSFVGLQQMNGEGNVLGVEVASLCCRVETEY